MEYQIQNLLKLKNLERIVMDLLEKIDKEIIQTDVEWLHLKNISEVNNSSHININTQFDGQLPDEALYNKYISSRSIKSENIDDVAVNSIMLNLSPLGQNSFSFGTAEEESESD